jgi:hypothetical protein
LRGKKKRAKSNGIDFARAPKEDVVKIALDIGRMASERASAVISANKRLGEMPARRKTQALRSKHQCAAASESMSAMRGTKVSLLSSSIADDIDACFVEMNRCIIETWTATMAQREFKHDG